MLGDQHEEIANEKYIAEEEDLEYSPQSSSSEDESDDENQVDHSNVDLEEVTQINLERAALESREIPKTRGGKLFSGHRFIQQEFPSDEEDDEEYVEESSDSEEDLEDQDDDEMADEVLDNIQNARQVYNKKELLVKDAKILRNMKEVVPVEGSDLEARMEKLLQTTE